MASPSPIAAAEVRFRSLFEHTPELVLYQNTEGIILDANPAFLHLIGRTKAQVMHRPYNDFLPPEVRGLYSRKLREACTGKTVRFDLYAAQGDSASRHWDVMKIPLEEDGTVVGVHMVARDITEKTQNQEEIFAQNRDLQQFTYIVSHNLRAPLANALGLVDLLETEDPSTTYFGQTLGHLRHNLEQLDLVLRDMNSILAIRDKHDLEASEVVSLSESVAQVVRHLQDVLTHAGATVHLHIPAHVQVRANRAYLHSIFLNLLSNAIKYRAEGRPLQVTISATGDEHAEKQLVLADNGSGFDQALAGDDIFKLYKRFHPHQSGRGVGLYLVKTHVESLGGRIEVSSQVGEGTRFLISLP